MPAINRWIITYCFVKIKGILGCLQIVYLDEGRGNSEFGIRNSEFGIKEDLLRKSLI